MRAILAAMPMPPQLARRAGHAQRPAQYDRSMTDAFDFDAFLRLPRLSGLRASPDGRRLIVTVARPGPDGKKMHSSIWELDPGGDRRPWRLTRSAPGESSATFARDGSILFTSSRPDPDRKPDDDDEEVSGLWQLPAGGGEARLLAAPSGGVDAVVAARDADVVVYAASVFPGADAAADRERHQARKKAGVEALLFDQFPIRHWDAYHGPRERHLFAAPLPAGEDRITDPVDLTPAAGNSLVEQTFDVSPDGSTVVAGVVRADDRGYTDFAVVAVDRASGEHRQLTPDDAWYTDPAISPDGRSVACLRHEKDVPERVGDETLWIIDLASGEGRDATPDLDAWPQHPTWSPDGASVWFLADHRGGGAVYRHDLDAGSTTLVADDGAFTDLVGEVAGGPLALRSTYAEPPVPVRLADAPGTASRRIRAFAELDADALAALLPGRLERVSATAADGQAIASWLVLPRDASADAPVPLVVFVHGGPISSWNAWSWRWSAQLMAGRGLAVLLPDPALSTGYGHAFVQRGWGRWGAEPYTDVMAAVDAVLERPEIDADRTALMGGSFGGYMANWVAGSTDRFRAIITHASLWDLRGFHGTTDYGPDWEREFGDPYADASRYEAWSPSRLLGNIRTPMLVIHGQRDLRVPIGEALRLWTDLRRHGVPARFLYFPDENHWILKPQNARLWYETVWAFLDEHLRGEPFERPSLL